MNTNLNVVCRQGQYLKEAMAKKYWVKTILFKLISWVKLEEKWIDLNMYSSFKRQFVLLLS